ncbi:MAG: Chemotaxis response regulator protein-glutamate methylesterase [Verrucomicrobiae bacterium]|nr:Chemotaxis response regulator protein-glutamate methylesterase [Verrucomicrobiae bacterium]
MKNTQPIHLLLVDDNPVDAALAQRMLQSLENELAIAAQWVDSAEKALLEVRNRAFDVMLLDYNLPGISGLEVLAQIHQLPPNQQPAVIMLTASGSEKIAVEAMKNGARDYLRKEDLAVAPLLRAIISALSQKRMQDQLAAYVTQTQADLKMAHELQCALLPRHFPLFPHTADDAETAVRFHARYVSTTDLGGDFYSVVRLSDTVAGVFICDVMGHGVRAALVTAMIRALVEELQPLAREPGRFLAEVNTGLLAILQHTDEPLFATALYLIADIGRGEIRYANAGHPSPLHVHADRGVVDEFQFAMGNTGPALGLFRVTEYPTDTVPIAGGDLLVLFTDGLFEVQGPADDEYGPHRLREAVQRRVSEPPAAMLDGLMTEVRQFSSTGQFVDDVCLLAIEVRRLAAGLKEAR